MFSLLLGPLIKVLVCQYFLVRPQTRLCSRNALRGHVVATGVVLALSLSYTQRKLLRSPKRLVRLGVWVALIPKLSLGSILRKDRFRGLKPEFLLKFSSAEEKPADEGPAEWTADGP